MRWFRSVVGVLEKCFTLFGVPVRRTGVRRGAKATQEKVIKMEKFVRISTLFLCHLQILI